MVLALTILAALATSVVVARSAYRAGYRRGALMGTRRRQALGHDTAADLLHSAIECCQQAENSLTAPLLPWNEAPVRGARLKLEAILANELDSLR